MSSFDAAEAGGLTYLELSAQLRAANFDRYTEQVQELFELKKLVGQFKELRYEFTIKEGGAAFSYGLNDQTELHQSAWVRLNSDRALAEDALIQFMAHAEAEMTLFVPAN